MKPILSARLSRRRFIHHTALLSAGCLIGPAVFGQTPNPPVSTFNKDSTAEQVTEGLDLRGKLAVVTGANSGLGFETARVLALRGAHVVIVARTAEKAEQAAAAITGETTAAACDLSDFNSVVRCARQIEALGKPIDMLILNAGIMELPELEQVYGLEKQFVVNYLGHFLLTLRLLEPIKAAPQGRIVTLSSGHYKSVSPAGIEFDNLSGQRGYDPTLAYGQSKLAIALFARELSTRLADTNVTANAVLPGVIMTNLGRHMPVWKTVLAKAVGWTFMRSVEAGAATSCYVATHPTLAKVSGHYFKDCNTFVAEGPHMDNPALAKQLWEVSQGLVEPYLNLNGDPQAA